MKDCITPEQWSELSDFQKEKAIDIFFPKEDEKKEVKYFSEYVTITKMFDYLNQSGDYDNFVDILWEDVKNKLIE